MLGADGVLGPGGGVLGAGSGQSCYLGYRGVIYLRGLTCSCRLGDPKSDSAQVDLFILQAELPAEHDPVRRGKTGQDASSTRARSSIPPIMHLGATKRDFSPTVHC